MSNIKNGLMYADLSPAGKELFQNIIGGPTNANRLVKKVRLILDDGGLNVPINVENITFLAPSAANGLELDTDVFIDVTFTPQSQDDFVRIIGIDLLADNGTTVIMKEQDLSGAGPVMISGGRFVLTSVNVKFGLDQMPD